MRRRVWMRKWTGVKGDAHVLYWVDDAGRQRSESLGREVGAREAEDRRREKEHGLNAGTVGMTASAQRISQFAADHLALLAGRLQPKSVSGQKQALDSFVAACGDIRLDRLSPAHIERWFSGRLAATRAGRSVDGLQAVKKLSPATANKDLRGLRAAFEGAVLRGLLPRNPCQGIKPVKEPARARRVLSADEVKALLAAAEPENWRMFLLLALTTGFRREDLCHLRWEDVDLEAGIVRAVNRPGHRTKSGREDVAYLPASSVQALADFRRGQSGDGLVFRTQRGTAFRNNLLRRLDTTCEAAGIARCRIHDLKRTYASALANSGAPASVLQKMAHHASLATTNRFYVSVSPESERAAAERLPYAKSLSNPCEKQAAVAQGKTA